MCPDTKDTALIWTFPSSNSSKMGVARLCAATENRFEIDLTPEVPLMRQGQAVTQFLILSAVMKHGQNAREQEEEALVILFGGIPVRE